MAILPNAFMQGETAGINMAGGEAHFDNMRGFFTGNGFTHITEQKDFKNPKFVAGWGVSDEDLFDKTHERLNAKHAEGQPSFTLVFTSTNHSPFDFPDGRIELYEQPKATDNNAIGLAPMWGPNCSCNTWSR